MATNVDPEEAKALLELSDPPEGGPGEVRPRDFARPVRLTGEELDAVALKVRRALPGTGAALARALRKHHALALVEVGEVSAEGLLEALPEPLAVVRFTVGGQPAWFVWELAPAVAAVEVALGAGEPASLASHTGQTSQTGPASERPFSAIERSVFARLVEPLIAAVCSSLGLAAKGVSVPKMREELGSWRDGGERADHRRLFVHLGFEGPGGPSSLRLYVPGVDPARPDPKVNSAGALPARLAEIQVVLAAHLGASDVPLAELLELEPGDVIPLTTPAGKPLRIYVEDRLRARAVLGQKDGRLAVQIVEIGPEDEDA